MKEGTRAFLRPLRLTDESLVRDLFYHLSPESVHYRFFAQLKSMPHAKLQELLRIDYEDSMALVVLTAASDEDGEMIGIAHFINNPRTNFAESAFLVRDDWQGKGVGTHLMAALVGAARERGIAGFSADVLATNVGMLRVFHKSRFPVESRLEGGVYALKIPFRDDV